jgi:hypothetical protein
MPVPEGEITTTNILVPEVPEVEEVEEETILWEEVKKDLGIDNGLSELS